MKLFQLPTVASLCFTAGLLLFGGCYSSGEIQISERNPKVVIKKSAAIIGGTKALQQKLDYPDKARRDSIEIVLKANVLVNKSGRIEKVSFDTETEYGFQESAEKALHQVHFKPGERNGKPVSMFIRIPVKFEL